METVFVLIKTQPGLVEPVLHEVASNPDVTEATAVTGAYDILARVEKEYDMLNDTLATMLATVGIEYLYLDYVTNWTTKKGVPLPLD